jgi:hypothetical protein
MGFRSEVDEGMDALANEVEAFGLLLIIEKLELYDPLKKKLVSVLELFG